MKTLHLYRSRTGYRWRFIAANGKIRHACTETYNTRRAMIACACDAFPDFCDGLKTFHRENFQSVRETIRVKDETHKKETR